MSTKKKPSSESIVREIKRKTRRKYSAEEKIRIVLEGLRGEQSITDLCRKEGIHPGIYYKWSKAFLEAGKQRLTGDTVREAGALEQLSQSPQPLPRILNLRYPRVSILPQAEEFLVMLYGFIVTFALS